MSNIGLIIEERARDIGDFLVGRLLPFRKKRMVGPFIFLDHMGPTTLKAGKRFDVEPHPHIGLSTLTYLMEGRIVHRDSLGTEQLIAPGAVNWMTAGSGVVHSERGLPEDDDREKTMHGLQIWVALPRELEDMNPAFTHVEERELPNWQEGGIDYKLIAGSAYGRQSPVPVHSELFFLELTAQSESHFKLSAILEGESALYVLKGSIRACGEEFSQGQLLVTKEDADCQFTMSANAQVFLFGGPAFPEERFIYWNFVSSEKEKLEAAKEKWRKKDFPPMPNDSGYVPLPAEG